MAMNPQSAYGVSRVSGSENVDEDVFAAMRLYMTEDLGISADIAEQRAHSEVARNIPKSVLRLLSENGIPVEGHTVLDLGAGLGGMSEELTLSGACAIGLEPGEAWAALTRRRVERHGRPFRLLNAVGESIPLPDESVDLIVSLQVLEHVATPDKVLAEAWRVLRRGGYFYLACENYLAFWEPHYQIPWFPMLPKPFGRTYLKMLGRSPRFLDEAITYTTFPAVVGTCRRLGFIRVRDEEIAQNLLSKGNLKWRLMRLMDLTFGGGAPRFLGDLRSYFKVGIYELFRKPIG
jgi:SAM-dependent methyltransferase